MILHFVTDEKFIDMAYREFEAIAPGRNRFLIISRPSKLKYIKRTPVEFLSRRACSQLLRKGQYDGICLHNLYSGASLLSHARANSNVAWIGWGFDYYGGPLSSPRATQDLLLPQTQALVDDLQLPSERFSGALARKLRAFLAKVRPPRARYCLDRVDYFSPVLDSEFEMVRQHHSWFHAQYLPWNYGTVEDDFFVQGTPLQSMGPDLLIGNSASAPNNHLEVFDWLRERDDLGNRKIIVPLSYGDERYKAAIIKAGRARLGERFTPLLEFQPMEEYLQTLSGCGFVFMNHLRQQGVGNVVISLLAGAKIFLHPKNKLSDWLRQKGAVVFDIRMLKQMGIDDIGVFQPLQEHEKAANRKMAITHWGREVQREKTRRVVQLLCARRITR